MNRKNFIRSTFLTGTGLIIGSNLVNALATKKSRDILDLPLMVRMYFPSIAVYSNQKVSSCFCTGTSCVRNNANPYDYHSQSNFWNVRNDDRFLYYQMLNDPYGDGYIKNCSVPFLTGNYNPIMKIEGPSLYGLCCALSEFENRDNKSVQAKDVFAPVQEISNAGYRFDVDPCKETHYTTKAGRTTISYNPAKSTVQVKAEHPPTGNVYHNNTYIL